ncbi:MAG TPA: thiol reductant ABC exporter subunit CydD, partial [Acetobacteraceae bacterium]|nr:thiol reductant ABC exporter subunit CydD [Acetobacteraceae bacterium]
MARSERDGSQAGPSSAAARAWLRQESRSGSRAARPVVLVGLGGTAIGIAQAWCIAAALAAALTGAGHAVPALVAFGGLAVARAALGWLAALLAARA